MVTDIQKQMVDAFSYATRVSEDHEVISIYSGTGTPHLVILVNIISLLRR